MPQLEIRIAQTGGELADISCGGFLAIRPRDTYVDAPPWEPFALEAYRKHYGVRAADPRFVVCGEPTEDATLAIAALAGLIPSGRFTENVLLLVDSLGRGMPYDLTDSHRQPEGAIILTWRERQVERRREMQFGNPRNLEADDDWELSVSDWELFLTDDFANDEFCKREFDEAYQREMQRRAVAP